MSYRDIEQYNRRERETIPISRLQPNYLQTNIRIPYNNDYYYSDMMSDSDGDDLVVETYEDAEELNSSDDDEEEEVDLGSDNDTLINQQPAYTMDVTSEIKFDNKISQKDFIPISVLGKGGFGTVLLVKKLKGKDQNKIYAMKIVKKVAILRSDKDTIHTKAERSILERVDHPFIVKMQYAFQSPGKLYLVLEFAQGGELFSLLEKQRVFNEEWASFYLAEIALALGYLHNFKVIYRDLKPENVLLAADGHVKLTDFGLCKQDVQPEERALTFCGTVEYMAPEVIRQRGHNKEVDWWSLGTLMYDMINGSPPFQGENREDTIRKVTTGRLTLYTHMTKNSKDLVVKLLQRNPSKRLGSGEADVNEVLAHSFFRHMDMKQLLNKQIKPPFVPTISSDIDHSLFDEKFTNMEISASPETIPQTGDTVFDGFTYVHPSIVESFNKYSEFDQFGMYNRAKMSEIVGSLKEQTQSFNKSNSYKRNFNSDNRFASFDKTNNVGFNEMLKFQNANKYDKIDKSLLFSKNGHYNNNFEQNTQNCQQFNAINLKHVPNQNPIILNSTIPETSIQVTQHGLNSNQINLINFQNPTQSVPHNNLFNDYPRDNNIRMENRKENFINLNNFTKNGTIKNGHQKGDSIPIDIYKNDSIKKNGKNGKK